jgi:hypothetical protein
VADIDRLRMMLDEEIKSGQTEADTGFTDAQLLEIIDTEPNMKLAAAVGWSIKAARAASLVDVAESGTTRPLSQRHKNAVLQARFYMDAGAKELGDQTNAIRVAGRIASLVRPADATFIVNEFIGPQTDSVRCYPTMRMPSILG